MALRVLLADESSTIKKVMQLALQDFAVEVKSVQSGMDVLAVAKQFQPDIVFADILLHKKNGYEVSQELKQDPYLKSLPVVLMWSSFMEMDETSFRTSGATARLEKPFDVETLRNLVMQNVPKTKSNPISGFLSFPSSISAPFIEEEDEKSRTPRTATTHGAQPTSTFAPPATPTPPPAQPVVAKPVASTHLAPPPVPPETTSNFTPPTPAVLTPPPAELTQSQLTPPPMPALPELTDSISKDEESTRQWDMDSFQDIQEFASKELTSPFDDLEDPDEDGFSHFKISSAPLPEQSTAESSPDKFAMTSMQDLTKNTPATENTSPSLSDIEPVMSLPKIDNPTKLSNPTAKPIGSVQPLQTFEDEPTGSLEVTLELGDEPDAFQLTNFDPVSNLELAEETAPQSMVKGYGKHITSGVEPSLTTQNYEKTDLESMVKQQARDVIEEMVKKILPDLCEELIRKELQRLLAEPNGPNP